MRYKAKSIAALQLALGNLPDKMRVEVDRTKHRSLCKDGGRPSQGDCMAREFGDNNAAGAQEHGKSEQG